MVECRGIRTIFKLMIRSVTLNKWKTLAHLRICLNTQIPTQRNKRNFLCGKDVSPCVGLLD